MKYKDIILILEGLLKENPKRKIHLSISIDSSYKFFNGFCINYKDEETLSFIDDKLGYIVVPYSQIINIEPFIEK